MYVARMEESAQIAAPDIELFRDVFEASAIGIAVQNFDGQILFVNPAFCTMLGRNEEELRGKCWMNFSPREDAERDWTLFQQLRAGSIDHYQLEKGCFRRDGSLARGQWSISLLKGRPSPLVIAMVEDIADKRRLKERADGILEALDVVTNQMAAAVTHCSRDLRYLWRTRHMRSGCSAHWAKLWVARSWMYWERTRLNRCGIISSGC